jgi:acyl carrier protein
MEKLHKIIAKMCAARIEEVTPDKRLVDDLGADSLDMIEMLMEVEEEFAIEVPDEASDTWKTVADVEKYLESVKAV